MAVRAGRAALRMLPRCAAAWRRTHLCRRHAYDLRHCLHELLQPLIIDCGLQGGAERIQPRGGVVRLLRAACST